MTYIIGRDELIAGLESHIEHTQHVRALAEALSVDEDYFKHSMYAMFDLRKELFERLLANPPEGGVSYEQMVYGAAFVDAFFLAIKAVIAANGQNPAHVIPVIKRILGVNRVATELGIEIPDSVHKDIDLLFRSLYGENVDAEVAARMAEEQAEDNGSTGEPEAVAGPVEFDPDKPHIHCDFCGAGVNLPEGTTKEDFRIQTATVIQDALNAQRKENPGARVQHLRTQVACLECSKRTPEELLTPSND